MDNEIVLHGRWEIKNEGKKDLGNLRIDKQNKNILLKLILPSTEDNPFPSLKNLQRISVIQGEIDYGGSILLYDNQIIKNSAILLNRTEYIIRTKYAFWNYKGDIKEKIELKKVAINFGEIIDWTGLCYFDWNIGDDNSYKLEWKNKDNVCVCVNDNLQISFLAEIGTMSSHITSRKHTLEQKVCCVLEYRNSEGWDKIICDINKIKKLITLGINKSVNIEKIIYFQNITNGNEVEEYPFDCFIGTQENFRDVEGIGINYLFELNDLICDNANSLKMWFEKFDKLDPIVELFEVGFYTISISNETYFLNIMQALETYHARFVSNDFKRYIRIVDEFLKDYYKVDKKEEFNEHILSWRSVLIAQDEEKSKMIYLKSRLGYLFVNNFEMFFGTLNYKLENFIRKLVDTRNYYTHYSIKKNCIFTKGEMPYVIGVIENVLRYYILKEIGIDKDKIIESISTLMKRNEDAFNIFVMEGEN